MNGARSSEQSKLTPAWSESKVKVAVVSPVSGSGPVRIVVSGQPSVVKVWVGRGRVDVVEVVHGAELEDVLAARQPLLRQLQQREVVVRRVAGVPRTVVDPALELQLPRRPVVLSVPASSKRRLSGSIRSVGPR